MPTKERTLHQTAQRLDALRSRLKGLEEAGVSESVIAFEKQTISNLEGQYLRKHKFLARVLGDATVY